MADWSDYLGDRVVWWRSNSRTTSRGGLRNDRRRHGVNSRDRTLWLDTHLGCPRFSKVGDSSSYRSISCIDARTDAHRLFRSNDWVGILRTPTDSGDGGYH